MKPKSHHSQTPKGGINLKSFGDKAFKSLAECLDASIFFWLDFMFYRYVTTYKVVINTAINSNSSKRWGYYAILSTCLENNSFLPRQNSPS